MPLENRVTGEHEKHLNQICFISLLLHGFVAYSILIVYYNILWSVISEYQTVAMDVVLIIILWFNYIKEEVR